MKIPVVIRKEYVWYLERYNGNTYAHCDVFRYNKTIKSSLLKDWETLCLLHSEPIYAMHTVGDKKQLKFFKMCGFVYQYKKIGSDLKEYAFYIKEFPNG